MDKDLGISINERKRMAVEKQIYMKAKVITEGLGYSYCISRATLDEIIYEHGRDSYSAPAYDSNGFKIEPKGTRFNIEYKDEMVYEGGPSVEDVECYIPGEWEDSFERLYYEAKFTYDEKQRRLNEAAVAEAARDKAREEGRLKARFGLK